ncbi:hypothetical protein WJT74_10395 [Sphingomicrobium sp. XHP0239]|uniref:hypothetical protein n=1 Tax=Sphingomicrobium maritimum TaxID=3133972 RepID=UPI0031CC9466
MSDGAKLFIALGLGWVGLAAGLILSGAAPLRLLGEPVAVLLAMVWTAPGALIYLFTQQWLGTHWWRLFLAALGTALVVSFGYKWLQWPGAPPQVIVNLLRYSIAAALGAATGFWSGLRLTRFEPLSRA